ncbi:MAG: hypothetical protein HYT11_04635 [Candidatus Levybacteria bacterium]|nr:hypothetical protein [Candidatus Levybacteria bacterium]
MKLVKDKITPRELKDMARASFGSLVKAVVDIEKEIMVLDAELHADEEAYLLENGSSQYHLWGINLYPELPDDQFIEFDSMINVRPSYGNTSRSITDPKIRVKIKKIVKKLVIL